MLDALIVPAVPRIKRGPFSAKMQQRLDEFKMPAKTKPAAPGTNSIAQQEAYPDVKEDIEGMEGMVTGWGDDSQFNLLMSFSK
jgi:hypothetical protein